MSDTNWIDLVKWDKDGLVACVVQDAKDGAVLMVAYMNKESLQRTIQEQKCCFWSRSRKKFWLKGEESGNVQVLKKISIDCDGDCLLAQVEQIGGAACHTGMRSCFYRKLDEQNQWQEEGQQIFDPSQVYKK